MHSIHACRIPCDPTDLRALLIRERPLVHAQDALTKTQRILRPQLAAADLREQDTHIHIVRLARERIRHPARRTRIVAQLEVGTRHIGKAFHGRIALLDHIGKGIDDLRIRLLLHLCADLCRRFRRLLCHVP